MTSSNNKTGIDPADKISSETSVLIKRSRNHLWLQIAVLQAVAMLFVAMFLSSVTTVVSFRSPFAFLSVNMLIVILISTLDLVVSVFMALAWKKESYVIHPNKIVHTRGILFRRHDTYECNNIETVRLKQGVLAKLLNYGTLAIYDPALRRNIILYNIPDPLKYKKNIRNQLLATGEKKKQFILS